MKIASLKFGFAFGIAMGISFLLCNIIFAIGGDEFSLNMVNSLFHNMDFKPLMIGDGINLSKLMFGMIILFLEGLFTGYITAAIYNSFNKNKYSSQSL